MSQVDDDSLPAPMVRTTQVIILAMTAGLVFFLVVVLFVRGQPGAAAGPARPGPLISYVAAAFAAAVVPMSLIVPSAVVKSGRAQIAPGPDDPTLRLAGVYQTSLIMGAALNEGPALFALVAFMIEGLPWVLGIAALLILGVAARFRPGRGSSSGSRPRRSY